MDDEWEMFLTKLELPVKRVMTLDEVLQEYGDVLTEEQLAKIKEYANRRN